MSQPRNTRPRIYRDPVHGQLRYKRVDLSTTLPVEPNNHIGWIIPKLINSAEFQRLRHIRQNGLTNLVFHGAEHSRFSHSMGVAHLADEMYIRIIENMGEQVDQEQRLATIAAALVHDVGHGPFSHALEEALSGIDVQFHHEHMTQRILTEPNTEIYTILNSLDNSFPEKVASYIDKTKRNDDRWVYKIVTSQLDADRLDYLVRDAMFTGIQGHGFDLPRLLDMLHHHESKRIAVDRHAIEAVESYLIMLEQMYRAVYFHPAVRSSTVLLRSILKRALDIYKLGDTSVFTRGGSNHDHPLQLLVKNGSGVDLKAYLRLNDHHVWALIEEWQSHKDKILSDLSSRLMKRNIFKFIDIDYSRFSFNEQMNLNIFTKDLVQSEFKQIIKESKDIEYYVLVDEPTRTSYKRYDWSKNTSDESIWMIGDNQPPKPIESEDNSIFTALKKTSHYPRLFFPHEIYLKVKEYERRKRKQ